MGHAMFGSGVSRIFRSERNMPVVPQDPSSAKSDLPTFRRGRNHRSSFDRPQTKQ